MIRERGEALRIAAVAAAAVLASFAGVGLHAQASPDPADSAPADLEIVVTGVTPWSEIVVRGRRRAPPCVPLAGDPLDEVRIPSMSSDGQQRRQSVIVPVAGNTFEFQRNTEQVTGPVFWQRAGTGIDQYVFRAPSDGTPMCIGAKWSHPAGYAQFRRITDSTPFEGKRVRFTAWAATGDAKLVRFWLAAGNGRWVLHNGGNTDNQPWGGDHGWTPILLEIGPIAEDSDHISYGFLLQGHGSVWIYQPTLEIVTDEPAASRTDEIAILGSGRSD